MQTQKKKLVKRKVLMLGIAIVMLAALSFSVTMAYLQATATVTNTMKLGVVGVVLKENTADSPDWDNEKENTTPLEVTISPNETVEKAPRLINPSGENAVPAYVRIKLSPNMADEAGIYNVSFNDVNATGFDNYPDGAVAGYWVIDTNDSTVWYYSVLLNPGETTEALFKEVELKKEYAGNGEDLTITVQGDAIQANHLTNVESEEVSTAQGAFALFNEDTEGSEGSEGSEG